MSNAAAIQKMADTLNDLSKSKRWGPNIVHELVDQIEGQPLGLRAWAPPLKITSSKATLAKWLKEFEAVEEQRLLGYRVTYLYAGETYVTQMDQDPGSSLPVRVQVTPV